MYRLLFRKPRLYVSADVVAPTGAPAFAQVLANPFLDDSAVQVIDLTMTVKDWAALRQNCLLNTYYHATFTWNGIAEDIGVRSHGGGSRSPIKPNLDLNFAHYPLHTTLTDLSATGLRGIRRISLRVAIGEQVWLRESEDGPNLIRAVSRFEN